MKPRLADLKDLLALTLYPEWAYAFCHLGKDIENRTWAAPARHHRRWIALHGGVAVGGIQPRGERYTKRHEEAVIEMVEIALAAGAPLRLVQLRDVLRCRGIVALAYLADVRSPMTHRARWHMPGCYGWHFAAVHVLPEPIPCRGALGLWTVPKPALEMIKKSIDSY
jgi:hypothetical protein